MAELIIFVPTRGRPQNVAPMIESFRETGAFEDLVDLVFLIDADDPHCAEYQQEVKEHPGYGFSGSASYLLCPAWLPMVPKLESAVAAHVAMSNTPVGFMGDDHRPRSDGWGKEYLRALSAGPAVISCPDGLRSDSLPTHWAMSAEIPRALGRMVPAPVEHLYCDNAVRDLAAGAGVYRWLPDLLVEHLHPLAGKAEVDEGYRKVNSVQQYQHDRAKYVIWGYRQMRADIATVKALKE